MNNFRHVDAATIEEAIELLGGGDARIIAGGTNILPLMKLAIAKPATLINLKKIPGISDITFDEAAGLRIGAMTTIDAVANNDVIKERYPLLGQAASSIASPQIRNVATVGGNLTQEPRCWYYRGVHPCWLKGGGMCYAAVGENEKHSILGAGTCNSVQPSDLAPALVALDAQAEIASPRGTRTIPVEKLFQTPIADSRRLSTLKPDEIITRIEVPPPDRGDVSAYVKKMERHVWTFASASLAARLHFDAEVVTDSRLVFGGVSQTPWRLTKAEEALKGKPLDEVAIEAASTNSTVGARPLKHNAYKVRLAQATVTETLRRLRPHK
jgi:xanthine dehydrogenase YagS FAD-binding subunit